MSRDPLICFVCPGLGHIYRGYETFTRECFDAIKSEQSFRIRLFKGAGPGSDSETTIPVLKRTDGLAKILGWGIRRSSYDAEQLSFTLGLLPYLVGLKPDVIFFSDLQVGGLLWRWREKFRRKFKLLFSNGAPAKGPFPRWDHVHQVSPEHYEEALRSGVPAEKQSLIPYGYYVPREQQVLGLEDKQALRRSLGLPVDRAIVLSVGLLGTAHKRMDYVIQEVFNLPEPRPYLVMLGQSAGVETERVRVLAEKMLGSGQYLMASLPPNEVQPYYSAADLFVLASFSEGLPRVLLEALATGLPCIAHNYTTTRYVIGELGYLRNLRVAGALSEAIVMGLGSSKDGAARAARHRDAYERFSWDRLAPQYVSMLQHVASSSCERTRSSDHQKTPVLVSDKR